MSSVLYKKMDDAYNFTSLTSWHTCTIFLGDGCEHVFLFMWLDKLATSKRPFSSHSIRVIIPGLPLQNLTLSETRHGHPDSQFHSKWDFVWNCWSCFEKAEPLLFLFRESAASALTHSWAGRRQCSWNRHGRPENPTNTHGGKAQKPNDFLAGIFNNNNDNNCPLSVCFPL